jgi:hypothetical protein
VFVLVDEARTKAWLRWIRDGEAAKAGLIAMVERDLALASVAVRRPSRAPRGEAAYHKRVTEERPPPWKPTSPAAAIRR